jgi:hypothetical protein
MPTAPVMTALPFCHKHTKLGGDSYCAPCMEAGRGAVTVPDMGTLADGERWTCPTCGHFFGVIGSAEVRAFVEENRRTAEEIRARAVCTCWPGLAPVVTK